MIHDYGKYSNIELFAALKLSKEEAEAAFAEIYSRYSQRIFAYCLRVTGNHDDARDIFQDTFLKFFKSVESHAVLDNIPAYLLTIARNLCLNYRRDHKIMTSIEDYHLKTNDSDYAQKELLQLISSALELLDFESREAFILRQYQGMSYEEIAVIVGDTVNAVKSRVWRAKERVKNILSPYLADLSK